MTEQEIESQVDIPALSAGQWLAKARKERSLEIADVAAKLRLAPRQIEAIEADDYQRLPGRAIVRGFVRNYARLLQLDAGQVVEAFERTAPSGAEVRISLPHQNVQFSEVDSGHRNRSTLWLTLGLAILIAVGFLAWWMELRLAAPKSAAVVLAPATSSNTPMETSPILAEPSVSESASNTGSPSAPPSVAPVPANVANHLVHLVFEGEAWVEVRDAGGKIVWQKTNPAGSEHDITAPLPLSFVIGNPAQVKMTYNGDPFDLAAHMQGSTARFKLER
jgi:cytoskeleton protein RodZ